VAEWHNTPTKTKGARNGRRNQWAYGWCSGAHQNAARSTMSAIERVARPCTMPWSVDGRVNVRCVPISGPFTKHASLRPAGSKFKYSGEPQASWYNNGSMVLKSVLLPRTPRTTLQINQIPDRSGRVTYFVEHGIQRSVWPGSRVPKIWDCPVGHPSKWHDHEQLLQASFDTYPLNPVVLCSADRVPERAVIIPGNTNLLR